MLLDCSSTVQCDATTPIADSFVIHRHLFSWHSMANWGAEGGKAAKTKPASSYIVCHGVKA
jgi:hypothetical protein